jgi:hypothetical protein
MEVAEIFNHVDQVTVLGVELSYVLFVFLVPSDTDFVTTGEFMLVCFDIVGDLVRRMFIHEANRALG